MEPSELQAIREYYADYRDAFADITADDRRKYEGQVLAILERISLS